MKVPKAKKLPSGAWRVQVMVDGKRVSITRDTEKACIAAAANAKANMEYQARPHSSWTVGDTIDHYIDSKDGVLSPSTINGYKKLRKSVFQDIINANALSLPSERVQRAVSKMSKEKSPKYVRNAYGLFTAAMGEYFPDKAFRVSLPQKEAPKIHIPTMDQIAVLHQDCKGTMFELPFLLAVWLGLRTSEIRGLTWDCIDGDILTIKQAMVEGEDGAVVKQPKTYSGNRRLKIPPYIQELLDGTKHTDQFVIHYSRNALYNHLQRACDRCNIPRFRFHDLRHVNASVMLSLNIPDKYAMERMGHSTNNMLKQVYQHTMPEKSVVVANMVDDYFSEKLHTNLHTEKSGA